ncbi:MAG: hypothetical protein SFW35_09735 [Chitinophagales bacterium]|nr:hypothetical protein [Chitinophagales bacterium]
MNGDELLVDTNILIYLQKGLTGIQTILNGKNLHVSFISEMELLSYPETSDEN